MEVKMRLEVPLLRRQRYKLRGIHLLTNLLHLNQEVLNARGLDKLGGFVLMIESLLKVIKLLFPRFMRKFF